MTAEKKAELVCRGSWALGTACGKCQRCIDTRAPSPPASGEVEQIARAIVTRSAVCGPDPCKTMDAKSCGCFRDAVNDLARLQAGAAGVPEDVRRLVIAARDVAADIPDFVRASPNSPQVKNDALVQLRELDMAAEAFSECVPYDDEPAAEGAAAPER